MNILSVFPVRLFIRYTRGVQTISNVVPSKPIESAIRAAERRADCGARNIKLTNFRGSRKPLPGYVIRRDCVGGEVGSTTAGGQELNGDLTQRVFYELARLPSVAASPHR